MLTKYYLTDNEDIVPNLGTVLLSSEEDLIKLENGLVYCDSKNILTKIRKLDDKGSIHLGCRGVGVELLCTADYIRFGSNFLIASIGWDEKKYKLFQNFTPKEELKLPEIHYLNIDDVSDEEACRRFELEMQTIVDSPALGIDFETNGFPEEVGFAPLGLSIVNESSAYYYDFNSYPANRRSKKGFYKALEAFVEKNSYKLYAFNVSFEIRCFYDMYNKFFKLQDTRVWCIIDDMRSNLKYCAQYYLGVGSWDDTVEDEHRALEESFQIPKEEFLKDYSKGAKAELPCAKKLFEFNKDNPDFVPRYKKYYGSSWACSNQKTVGKYCCYDSVMDIHIMNKIRDIVHIDHKYNDECYSVLLYNQYLLAMIELSGIYVEPKILDEERDTLSIVEFNTALYVNKEIVKYKIDMLKSFDNEGDFEPKLNPYLEYLIDEMGSFMFLNDPTKLGKEFCSAVRKRPDIYDKLVDKYHEELYFIVSLWNDDEEFEKVSKQRKEFTEIGKKLYEEWDLKSVFREFNEFYVENSGINKRISGYYKGSEEELRELLLKGPKVWKAEIPEKFWPEMKKYILNYETMYCPEEFRKLFELRKQENTYKRMVEALKGREIYSPIDHDLDWMLQADLNSPLFKEELGKLLQNYYERSYVVFASFADLCAEGKVAFTKEMFMRFVDADKKSLGSKDIHTVKPYAPFCIEEVDAMGIKEITDKKTGEKRQIMYRTGKKQIPIEWSVTIRDGVEKPPLTIPDKYHRNPWAENPEDVDNYRLDEEFEFRIFNLHKFLGVYKLNRVINKMLSTSVSSLYKDSFNVKLIDGSRCQRMVNEEFKEDYLVKYFTKTMANSAKSNRWASNCHSLLSATEDTRVALQSRIGTHFILPYSENVEGWDGTTYEIDGLNFRSCDLVKVSSGEMKRVSELTSEDEFDNSWLKDVKMADQERTGDVYWEFCERGER